MDVKIENEKLNYKLRANCVIVKDDIMPYRDEKGIYYTGLFQFLTNNNDMRV